MPDLDRFDRGLPHLRNRTKYLVWISGLRHGGGPCGQAAGRRFGRRQGRRKVGGKPLKRILHSFVSICVTGSAGLLNVATVCILGYPGTHLFVLVKLG